MIHKFPELAGRTIASAEVRLGNPDTTEPDEVDQEPLPDPVPLPRTNGDT